jgi:PAS domain S-box-containing protein
MSHDALFREQLLARLASAEAELEDLRPGARAAAQWPSAIALDAINEGFLILDRDWRVTLVNPAAERLVQNSRAELLGRVLWELFPEAGSRRFGREFLRAVAENVPVDFEGFYPEPLNAWYHVRAYPSAEGLSILFSDVTERKQVQAYREMGREVVQLLLEPDDVPVSIRRVVSVLKTRTGFDAVGIRLQDRDDFPYCVQEGFPEDFLRTENTIIERGPDGGVCRDNDGHVSLECTCGLVISGKTDPANPLFTPAGSCWTNDSFTLLDLPPDQDPRRHPRNRCIHGGYGSVALVPIRNEKRVIGLIQLNDRRKGRLTLERVELLEGLGSHIGSALTRKQAEEALRERTKELACLYGVADLIENEDSLEKILQGTVDLIPRGWFHNDIACARVVLDEREFKTADFRQTAWRQASNIILRGKPVGVVELCYLEERPIRDEGPFLREERNLVNAISQRLGRVAERSQAESVLRASDQRHRALLETVMSGFWLTDLQGRLLEVNETYCRMSGYSERELLAMRILDLEAAETASETAAHIETIVAHGEDRFESRHRRKDGTTFDVEASVQYLPLEGGRFICFLRDVSDRKQAEQQIERARNDAVREQQRLEVVSRALSDSEAELQRTNDELLVANETLWRNNETLEVRVATRTEALAHRTSQLQALARDLTRAEERERQRIADVIHDQLQQLLSVARIKLGMTVGQIRTRSNRESLIEADDLLAEALEITRSLTADLRPAILYRSGLAAALRWLGRSYGTRFDLTIAVEAEEDVDVEEELRVALFRSVRELLFNIVKHARVRIARVQLGRGADGRVRILVSDDGVGFDPEAVRAREGTGGGFGLFSLRERLELLGGELEVVSAPGRGASFTILAPPAAPLRPEAPASTASPTTPPAVAVPRPTGARQRPARGKKR